MLKVTPVMGVAAAVPHIETLETFTISNEPPPGWG